MLRRSIITVAAVAALTLVACGNDGGDAGATRTATVAAAGDVDRYCALTRELDEQGQTFFAGLGKQAGPQEFEAAERRFVETHADDLDELARVAPQEIAADVPTLFAGMRQRAGLEPATKVSEARASAAETRIRSFEQRRCRP